MVKNLLRTVFPEASMVRKLKKLSKSYGESQEQAVKRWGVQTCRDLAKYTLVVGSKPKFHKKAMMKDALNVIYSFDGSVSAYLALHQTIMLNNINNLKHLKIL